MSRISGLTALRIALSLGVVCLGVVCLGAGVAGAWPTNSPSAQMAARLKYHPPRNWIRHYLGDDRYKIVGKVWTVATTHSDTYYHRFTCPNLLRQSPNTVIGFFSPALAAEAGYQPDSTCQPQASSFIYIGPGRVSGAAGGRVTTINRGRTAQRIVLADRVSTVLLPPNWRRTQSGANSLVGYSSVSDTLEPLKGRGSIRISFVRDPTNGVAMNFLKAMVSSGGFRGAGGATEINLRGSAGANLVNKVNANISRVGGLSGVSLVPKSGVRIAGFPKKALVAGRGLKMYCIEDNSGGIAGASTIISSFRAR